ncbi:MAG: hypothetical protein NTV08_19655 [Verrucomicrobia bacterium]|jgi:hypothetical protein|nr:hypothetical protein [Verrucomicrobiota bacterium]
MPAKKTAPISPEGKRAAERVRLIFFSIAAANLVLVAIVMWQRRGTDKAHPSDPAKPAAVENGAPSKSDAAPAPAKQKENP